VIEPRNDETVGAEAVGVKSAEQQGRLMQHRTRDLLLRQRTQVINALRGHLAELGIVAAQGREGLRELLAVIADENDDGEPDGTGGAASGAANDDWINRETDHRATWCERGEQTSCDCARDRHSGASAITATVTDPSAFRSGRDFAAWIGLVPRQDSTGGKQKLGPISKQGDRYLRRILVLGAIAVLRYAKQSPEKYPWLTQLLARRPFKVVAIALANKMARVAFCLGAVGQGKQGG
jgi:transposase